jgi:hypothetical protein
MDVVVVVANAAIVLFKTVRLQLACLPLLYSLTLLGLGT